LEAPAKLVRREVVEEVGDKAKEARREPVGPPMGEAAEWGKRELKNRAAPNFDKWFSPVY
jgi:hypothetical protein